VFAVSAQIAKEVYLSSRESFTPDLSLWACGGREKPALSASPGDLLKSRLVLMPETPSALLESAFAQPLTDMVSRARGDLALGTSMTDRGYVRLIAPLLGADHAKAFDWSGFDTRVREDMIVTAFGVMRACFVGDDKWLDNTFLRFISHFLVKQVVIPGGWVYTVANGVPSGSPFTSLVDSIVNWLVLVDLEVTMGGLGAPRKNSRVVYGDDFVQAFRAPCFEKGPYIELARRRWGFVAKPSAAYEGWVSTTESESSLPFLSYRFPLGLPARPVVDALKIGLLPKRPRDSYVDQMRRVIYLDHFAPYDAATREYHVGYFRWVAAHIPGATYADSSLNHDLVSWWIHKAMANFVADGYAPGVTSLGEWFRQEVALRWPERWLPRKWAASLPVPYWQQGKLHSAAAHLRWGYDRAAVSTPSSRDFVFQW